MALLDLFSGIGGFSLGLERTGGFRTVAFCEREPYCQRVLAHHWPGVRGLQRRLARALAAASAPWPRTAEPPLRGVDDGLPGGVDRSARRLERDALKALGNAVVPLIPELIGRALLEGAAA